MDSAQWPLEARKRSLKEKGAQRNRQISMAIQTKAALKQAEKLKKQIAYEDKMQCFQFRMRREEIREVQVSWFTVTALVSSTSDLHRGLMALKVRFI